MVHVRSMVAAAIASIALVAAVGTAGAQTISNGEMTDGFITSTGDTMIQGWGSDACKGDPAICMAWDDQTYVSAPSSMRLDGATGGNGNWTQGISGLGALHGEEITLTGQAKITGPTDGTFRVAMVTACVGGGYTQLDYHQILRDSYESDWYQFSKTITVPTSAECTNHPNPAVIIHINPSGAGTFWVDDLMVEAPNGIHIDLTDGFMLDTRSVRLQGRDVIFDGSANYDARVITSDGRTVARMNGQGTRIADIGNNLPAGSYVLKVSSDRGMLSERFTVAR
ncbi:MAG: hypothetical protein GF331_25425 [Chitinivibrionales bacterium]|nr:hypothetical protein [Chitinivibrionales bacterium]